MFRGRRRRLVRTLSSLPRASPSDMLCEAENTPPGSFAVATHHLSTYTQCRYSLVPPQYAGNPFDTQIRHMSSQASGRKDPTAKRPTRVCDPYGQSGKPLSNLDAQGLMATLEDGWILEEAMSQQDHGGNASDDDSKDAHEKQSTTTTTTPSSIYREYYHDNFMDGSKFVAQVAAVAHNNNHYPCIELERRLMKREKAWRVVSVVKCFTPTLGGLSYNDFHLAMLVDVETTRPEVADLILDGEASLKKHT